MHKDIFEKDGKNPECKHCTEMKKPGANLYGLWASAEGFSSVTEDGGGEARERSDFVSELKKHSK